MGRPITYGSQMQKRVRKSDILFLRLGKREKEIMKKLKVRSDVKLSWKCTQKEQKSWNVHIVVGKYYVSIGWYIFVHDNNIKPGDFVTITVQSPSLFLMEIIPSSYFATSPAHKKCNLGTGIVYTPSDSSNSKSFSFQSEEKTQTASSPPRPFTADTRTTNSISTSFETKHQMPVPPQSSEFGQLVAALKKDQEDSITTMNVVVTTMKEAMTSMNDAVTLYKSHCLKVKEAVEKMDTLCKGLWM